MTKKYVFFAYGWVWEPYISACISAAIELEFPLMFRFMLESGYTSVTVRFDRRLCCTIDQVHNVILQCLAYGAMANIA
jgi:hypothetical protein